MLTVLMGAWTSGRLGPGARALGDRARVLGHRLVDFFPLTPLGLLVAAGSTFALVHYGVGRMDLLLLVLGMVGVAVTLLSVIATACMTFLLWRSERHRGAGDHLLLECGYPRRSGFVVQVPWYVPFVSLSWRWRDEGVSVRLRRRGLRVEEEVLARRRGLDDGVQRQLEVGDSFGLCRMRFDAREVRSTLRAPWKGALQHVNILRSLAAGDALSDPSGPAQGERVDLRNYVPGDPIRYVLWKVFARSRQVVVRTAERAIGPVQRTVAYLVTGSVDEPAAGAARVAVESGALGSDWVLGADGVEERATTRHHALDVLARSAGHRDVGGTGLARFLSDAVPAGRGRALVFVPGRPGPWVSHVAAALRAGGLPGVEIVVCTDGVETPAPVGWLRRVMLRPRASRAVTGVPPASSSDVASVCRSLGGLGAGVCVIDRVTGRVYGAAHQARLEAA